VSSSLLSDHYNRTRTRYYAKLDAASRRGDVVGFIEYAADGFVDQLREQIALVQWQQCRVAWVNYVHEVFQNQSQGETSKRRRTLLLNLPEDTWTSALLSIGLGLISLAAAMISPLALNAERGGETGRAEESAPVL
jgi:hypothetical protein